MTGPGSAEAARTWRRQRLLHRQLDPALDRVDGDDLADRRVRVDVGDVLADRHLAVLRRERVAPHLGELDDAHLLGLAEVTDRGAVLDELGGLELLVAEEVPPLRALLAPMPPDEPREAASCPRVDEPLARGRSRRAPRRRSRAASPAPAGASACHRARSSSAPPLLEPLVQGQRRADVLLVVAADVVEDRLVGRPVVPPGEPAFVLDDGRQTVGHACAVSAIACGPSRTPRAS